MCINCTCIHTIWDLRFESHCSLRWSQRVCCVCVAQLWIPTGRLRDRRETGRGQRHEWRETLLWCVRFNLSNILRVRLGHNSRRVGMISWIRRKLVSGRIWELKSTGSRSASTWARILSSSIGIWLWGWVSVCWVITWNTYRSFNPWHLKTSGQWLNIELLIIVQTPRHYFSAIFWTCTWVIHFGGLQAAFVWCSWCRSLYWGSHWDCRTIRR